MNIEICNYTKKLSKNLVLENINLSLSGGKIYGFVGKNGSGKTMLMRAICGLILPTSGFVKINCASALDGLKYMLYLCFYKGVPLTADRDAHQ